MAGEEPYLGPNTLTDIQYDAFSAGQETRMRDAWAKSQADSEKRIADTKAFADKQYDNRKLGGAIVVALAKDKTMPWNRQGNCRDIEPNVFFPSDGVGVEVAKQVCLGCPVRSVCLEYAIANKIDHGVWGGASERERRRITRQRRAAGY